MCFILGLIELVRLLFIMFFIKQHQLLFWLFSFSFSFILLFIKRQIISMQLQVITAISFFAIFLIIFFLSFYSLELIL